MPPIDSPAERGREIQAALQGLVAAAEAALKSEPPPAQHEHLQTIRRLADDLARLLTDAGVLAAAHEQQAETTGPPAVDWGAALQRTHRNEMLLKEASRLFVAECPRLLEQIDAGLATDNRAQVRRAANKLKSSAGIFAARAAVEAAAQLEQMAEEQTTLELEAAFARLREQAERVVREVQRFVETGVR
jgi:HPt (histidine-containing phosphotransfer) domain-containing protein